MINMVAIDFFYSNYKFRNMIKNSILTLLHKESLPWFVYFFCFLKGFGRSFNFDMPIGFNTFTAKSFAEVLM